MLREGEARTVWSYTHPNGLRICVTLANARGRVQFVLDGGSSAHAGFLEAGKEWTLCESSRTSLLLQCVEGVGQWICCPPAG